MSEVLVAPVEQPMELDESANMNDDIASGTVPEPTNNVSESANDIQVDVNAEEEDEEIIDIEGIDSPDAYPTQNATVDDAQDEVVMVEAPVAQKTRKSTRRTASIDPSSDANFDYAAWQAPPTRRAAKAAMTKLSHDFPAGAAPPAKAPVKVTPKPVKVIVKSEIEVKPEKPATPVMESATPRAPGRPKTVKPKAPLDEEEKPPSKRKVVHRQTRTVKPVGFYDERFDNLQRRHKATKDATLDLEDAVIEGVEICDKVLNGQAQIDEMFQPYNAALIAFKQAETFLRRTILLERKLASEVWGDNNIATFRDGVYTVDKGAIEASLSRPVNMPIPGVTRPYTKRASKPSTRYIDIPEAPTPTEKRKRKAEPKPESAVPPGRSRRKIVQDESAPTPPVKKLRLKKENIPDSPSDSPVASRSASPHESPAKQAPPPPPPPTVKPTPMPKFKHIDENVVSKKALPFIKDAPVLSCYCTTDNNGDRCFDNCVNRMLHMECGSRCVDNCRNKRFTNKQYAGFEPFFAGAKGWGIRATKPIRAGDFIVEYLGEVVDPTETMKRLTRYTKNGHKHHYMMGLRNNAVIDATNYGNFSRFVNHSCDPNAETQKWVVHKQMRVGFFAKKNIAPGEEIVFDYAFERFGEAAQVCYCGSKNCTGYIGSKPEEPAATGGEVDEDDGVSGEEEESEGEEDGDESPPTATTASAPTPKPKKRKLTEQERDFRKRCTKTRKRLVKYKREVRKVIGRKKVFSAEDVREFNRKIWQIQEPEMRFLLTNYLMTITDEAWLKWFVESQGVAILNTWIFDNLESGKSLRFRLRFNVQVLELLQRLPIADPMYFNQVNFLNLLEGMLATELPQDLIIQELMNDITEKVILEVGDEPPITDKDLARMMKRDGVSVLDLHDEMLQRTKALIDAWSVIKPPPKPATPEPEPVSEDEDIEIDDEFGDYPIRAHTPDSPAPDDVECLDNLDNPSPPPKNDDSQLEERHERRRSRSSDRYNHRHHRQDSIYRRGGDRRRSRSRSRSAERSYYGDRRRRGRGGRDRHSRYRSRSRSPYRDDRYERGGRYRGYDRRDRSYHRRTSEERYRYRRDDRSRSPRRDSRSRYGQEYTREIPKLIEVKLEPQEHHDAYSIFAKDANAPPARPRSPAPVVAPVLTSIAPITPAALKSSAANLDVANIFELSGSTAPRFPLKININGSSQKDAVPSVNSTTPLPKPTNIPSINLPGTGPKWLPTVQTVGFIATPPPTTSTVPTMVPPPSSAGFTFPPPMMHSPYMGVPPPSAMTPSYYPPSAYYPNPYFHPPPPPEPVPAPVPLSLTVKEEIMDPSPSSVVSDPIHRPQEEPSSVSKQASADDDEVVGDPNIRVYKPNPDWIETNTEDGIVYYYHKETRETMWTEPPPKTETPQPENPTPPEATLLSQPTSTGEATTTSSELGDSQPPAEVQPIQKEIKKEIIDTAPAPSSAHSHSHNRHAQHRLRARDLPADLDERKKAFKHHVWKHVFPYLQSKPAAKGFGENVLIQYARKTTHATLNDELRHGNTKLHLTKEVYTKARQYVDRSLPDFLASGGNIDAVVL